MLLIGLCFVILLIFGYISYRSAVTNSIIIMIISLAVAGGSMFGLIIGGLAWLLEGQGL